MLRWLLITICCLSFSVGRYEATQAASCNIKEHYLSLPIFISPPFHTHVESRCKETMQLGIHIHNADTEKWETFWYRIPPGSTEGYLYFPSSDVKLGTSLDTIFYYVEVGEGRPDLGFTPPHLSKYVARLRLDGSDVRETCKKNVTVGGVRGILEFQGVKDWGQDFNLKFQCYPKHPSQACKKAERLEANLCGYDCEKKAEEESRSEEWERRCATKCRAKSDFLSEEPSHCTSAVEGLMNDHVERGIPLPPNIEEDEAPSDIPDDIIRGI